MGSRELQGEAAADGTGSVLHQPEDIAEDRKGGETGMNKFEDLKLAKATEFEPSKAEGEYCVIDFEKEEIYKYYDDIPLDEVFTGMERRSLYVAYKEKSPCGNTD